jgi:hypothetical protein
MRWETFHLSQKELQRVAVISSCVKGELTCARAAELLDLTPRQIKRLKTRYRQGEGKVAIYYGETKLHHSRGNGTPNLWEFPLFRDGSPRQLTNFESGNIFNQRFSPDGKLIAISKGSISSDAVLFLDTKL